MYLINRDSKGKIRVVNIYYEELDGIYYIYRSSGQLNGKMTEQPTLEISEGKVKRTVEEQCLLKFRSLIKEKLDKGYKELEGELEDYTEEQLNEILPDNNTDANGVLKPMLAKQEDKVTNRKIFDAEWYVSRKIDGVRALVYWDGEEIHIASRGGGNYDLSTEHIRKHPDLIEFFKLNPQEILDAELYKHGKQLQQISGAARLEVSNERNNWLELYVYDIVRVDKTFKERYRNLEGIKNQLHLGFDPYREWKEGELQIQMVPHVITKTWDKIMNLHNDYVEEGFEGCVIRDPKKPYKPAGRTNSMIKIKKYKDSEFKVIGYELGLRGSEDMVFICETPAGLSFKAKPHGTRELRQWYVDNFNKECLNKMATVKYFYYSNGGDEITGVPLQGQVVQIRPDIDL